MRGGLSEELRNDRSMLRQCCARPSHRAQREPTQHNLIQLELDEIAMLSANVPRSLCFLFPGTGFES
jgi:hypothetical protein